MADLRIPDEWEEEFGVKILDPDGWRIDGTPLTVPLSREDFTQRMIVSTIMLRKDTL